jgi:hypothetical protein
MLKIHEQADDRSCWSKALDYERVFVLLARDGAAPHAIEEWARERMRLGLSMEDSPEIESAFRCAANMREERSHIRAALGK